MVSMALDMQRNWDVSMEKNLEKVRRSGKAEATPNSSKPEVTHSLDQPTVWTNAPVYLPDEIIIQILDHVSRTRESQYTLASCCQLSRQWYNAAVPFLYDSPYLYGKNFDPFVKAICPSINLHVRKSTLADLVRVLDMRTLVHQGSKSVTARLLGRTKNNLEAFVAPVASFAMNCFPALSKCRRLRLLDLSLVSESPPLYELLKTVSQLQQLTTFRLPRSSGFSAMGIPTPVAWPSNLENLSLSGGIDAHFLHGEVALPQTLRSLTIEHCPLVKTVGLMHFLRVAVRPLPHLESLKLAYLPRLHGGALDNLLFILPGLTKLSISVDYITPALFDLAISSRGDFFQSGQVDADIMPPTSRHQWEPDHPCQLRLLEFTNSGNPGVEDKISPIDVLIAIDEGSLPALRQVRVAKSLMWDASSTAPDVGALTEALKESAAKASDGADNGVWTVDG